MQEEEFELSDISGSFDFKGFLFKIFSFWWLFIISIGIGLSIAYYISVRKLPVFEMTNMIEVKENTNPLFTTNTSLTFNWGGTSNKVSSTVIRLNSRTHNEKVVKELQFYIDYFKQGEYQLEDAFGSVSYKVHIDSTYQLTGKPYKINVLSNNTFLLSVSFEEEENRTFFDYYTEDSKTEPIGPLDFSKEFTFNEPINTPFFKGKLTKIDRKLKVGEESFFQLSSLYGRVGQYKNIKVENQRASSVLKMTLTGNNKARLVEYLNGTVNVLSKDMLDQKNMFATRTIEFIDSMLVDRGKELQEVQLELDSFKTTRNIFDLDAESAIMRSRLNEYDVQEREIIRSINYYEQLEDYLRNREDYSELPVPTITGIQEGSIGQLVSQMVELSNERSRIIYSVQEGTQKIKDIDRRIEAIKNVLFENITSSKTLLNKDLKNVRKEIMGLEMEVRKLPTDQQELLKIERRYDLSRGTYDIFLSKKNEARLIKAANVSDVDFIDEAKDVGGGKIGPNNQLNYVMAILIGGLIPFLFVLLIAILDNKINNPKDIELKSAIPIIGVIGKSELDGNLAVFKQPRGAVAESFRAIRTSLQFLFKNKDKGTSKVLMCTSTISGEGKTFTSINLASVLALSGKKTVLVGLDLRKPKIFDDFGINNQIGVVNYLIGQDDLQRVTQQTSYDNLDVITSGPIPPNPSELLLDDRMDEFIESLKAKYQYVILDTPPIGLVSDALNLLKYVDTTLYLVRQNYTKRGMLQVINEKHKAGEVKNISFVMNFFEQKAKYGYGYAYGYGNGYGYGYGKYGDAYLAREHKKSLLKKIFRKIKRKLGIKK